MPVTPASPETGTISGLVDNQANQTTGLTVTITSATSATNNPPGGRPVLSTYNNSTCITVTGGQATAANGDVYNIGRSLAPGNRGGLNSDLHDYK